MAEAGMDLRAAMDALRDAWSDAHVCGMARAFLAECGWELEVDEGWIRVPPDAELLVYSAASIVSEHSGLGDHVEAIVYLGVERSPPNLWPVHGVLRLYLNASGRMITEDRYTAAWLRGERSRRTRRCTGPRRVGCSSTERDVLGQ